MLRPSISHADFLQRLDSALCGLDSSQTLRLNSDESAWLFTKSERLISIRLCRSFLPCIPLAADLVPILHSYFVPLS